MRKSFIKRMTACVLPVLMLMPFGSLAVSGASYADATSANTINVHAVRGANGLYQKADVTVYQIATCHPDGTWVWLGDFAANPPKIEITNSTGTVEAEVVFKITESYRDALHPDADLSKAQAESNSTGTLVKKKWQVEASALKTTELIKALTDVLKSRVSSAGLSPVTGTTANVKDPETGEESGFNPITLPNYDETPNGSDTSLDSNIGWYLIVTDCTGVEIQPTLETYDVSANKTAYIVPKANLIPLDKTIQSVKKDKSGTEVDSGAISATNHTSIASDGSTVEYKITTRTPKYSPDVTSLSQPFEIIDDPDDSIAVDINTVNVVVYGIGDGSDSVEGIKKLKVIENGVGKNTNGKVTITENKKGSVTDGFTVTFSEDWILQNNGMTPTAEFFNQDRKVEVTFKGTLTNNNTVYSDSASVNSNITTTVTNNNDYDYTTGNVNRVQVKYPNDYTTGQGIAEQHTSVVTYVGKIGLEKFGSDAPATHQTDVDFTLERTTAPTGNVTNDVITDGAVKTTDGVFDFGYLAPGTYKLTEGTPPAGYSAVGEYTFTVSAKGNDSDVEFSKFEFSEGVSASGVKMIHNNNGNADIKVTDTKVEPVNLPGTGGAGTYLFTAFGICGIILAGAGYIVLLKKKKV